VVENKKFVVENGRCAARKGKFVVNQVLEHSRTGLDHGEIIGVAAAMVSPSEYYPLQTPWYRQHGSQVGKLI
jgi:hypothetical protein